MARRASENPQELTQLNFKWPRRVSPRSTSIRSVSFGILIMTRCSSFNECTPPLIIIRITSKVHRHRFYNLNPEIVVGNLRVKWNFIALFRLNVSIIKLEIWKNSVSNFKIEGNKYKSRWLNE